MPSMSAYQNILSGNGMPCERESGLTLLNVFVKIGYPRAVSVTRSEFGSCVSKKQNARSADSARTNREEYTI